MRRNSIHYRKYVKKAYENHVHYSNIRNQLQFKLYKLSYSSYILMLLTTDFSILLDYTLFPAYVDSLSSACFDGCCQVTVHKFRRIIRWKVCQAMKDKPTVPCYMTI